MSRTPVREALGRLEQEGLVRAERAWGYRVRPISVKEVLDVYTVREPLELQAALDAIQNVDDNALAELSSILSEAQEFLDRGQPSPFLVTNRKFHMTIAKLAGNTVLYQMLSALNNRIRLICGMIIREHSSRAKKILEENFAILDALKHKDPAAVEAAVCAHLQRARGHALTFCAQELSFLYLGQGEEE